MKRYDIYQAGTRVWETDDGEYYRCTDADSLTDELYETINRNASKIIKLEEQNKEILKVLRKIEYETAATWVCDTVRGLIEKIEKE